MPGSGQVLLSKLPCAGTPARLVDGSTSPLEAVTVLVSPVGLVALVGLVVALEIVPSLDGFEALVDDGASLLVPDGQVPDGVPTQASPK